MQQIHITEGVDINVNTPQQSFESSYWPQSWKDYATATIFVEEVQHSEHDVEELLLPVDENSVFQNTESNEQRKSSNQNENIFKNEVQEVQTPRLQLGRQSRQVLNELNTSMKSLYSFKQQNVHGVETFEDGASLNRTLINAINALAGIGLLTTPYMLAQSGYISLFILVFIATLCYYTGNMLRDCQQVAKGIDTYPDIGQYARGRTGRIIVSIFLYLELYGSGIELVILEAKSIRTVFPQLENLPFKLDPIKVYCIISGLMFLPTIYIRNLKALAFLSAGGVFVMFTLATCVLGQSIEQKQFYNPAGKFAIWSGLPFALGVSGFYLGGHSLFPSIYTSMHDKDKYSLMLRYCFLVVCGIYCVVAYFGFSLLGPTVSDSLTSSMILQNPRSIFSYVGVIIVMVIPVSKYSLILSPVLQSLEEFISKENQKRYRAISTCLRTMVVASTIIFAFSIPFFGYLMQFIGACLSISASIIFPSIFYLSIFGKSISYIKKGFLICIIILGIVIAVLGTYSSIERICTAS